MSIEELWMLTEEEWQAKREIAPGAYEKYLLTGHEAARLGTWISRMETIGYIPRWAAVGTRATEAQFYSYFDFDPVRGVKEQFTYVSEEDKAKAIEIVETRKPGEIAPQVAELVKGAIIGPSYAEATQEQMVTDAIDEGGGLIAGIIALALGLGGL